MYLEDDLLQLSALQHFIFCPRQCALIHIEQVWQENLFTAEGRIMHEDAHGERAGKRKDVKIERGLALRSLKLGLSGKADVVEFHRAPDGSNFVPFPVEYKRGKPKADDCDKIQLCAQALCLEEMLRVAVPRGAMFYGKTRHRLDVEFDEALRKKTEDAAERLHQFILEGKTPTAEFNPKCKSCSLTEVCLPKTVRHAASVRRYLEMATEENEKIS